VRGLIGGPDPQTPTVGTAPAATVAKAGRSAAGIQDAAPLKRVSADAACDRHVFYYPLGITGVWVVAPGRGDAAAVFSADAGRIVIAYLPLGRLARDETDNERKDEMAKVLFHKRGSFRSVRAGNVTPERGVIGVHHVQRHVVLIRAVQNQEAISAKGVAGLITETDAPIAGKSGSRVLESNNAPIERGHQDGLAFFAIGELDSELDHLARSQER